MNENYFIKEESHPVFDLDEYYRERFDYESECEEYDEEEELDDYEWNGYSNEEDYWRERI